MRRRNPITRVAPLAAISLLAVLLVATAAVPAAAAAARVPPSSVLGDCDTDTVPVVVASDLAAQSDIYSAVTLAGVLGDACIVLAGPRNEAMTAAQQARLDAAASGGYVVGGLAAVPDGKIAGRAMARLGGADRWATALLVGEEAANPGSAPRSSVAADEEFAPMPGASTGSAATRVRVPPASVQGDCDSSTAPVVVASDLAAQSDIYSAVTLAGVLGEACIVLAGPRGEAVPSDQQARLDAAAAGGYVVGGFAAVPDEKIAGRTMARLGGADRWATALLVGEEAANPGSAPRTTVASAPLPRPPDKYDAFYTQHVSLGGLDIIAPDAVDPLALRRAAAIISELLANRPDLLTTAAEHIYVVVGGQHMLLRDLPEERRVDAMNIWPDRDINQPIRGGQGPSIPLPFVLVSESNLLCTEFNHHPDEDTVVHEFAHGIHWALDGGLQSRGVSMFDDQVEELYRSALSEGLWEGHYAAVNHMEYFAEIVQTWAALNNPQDDFVHPVDVDEPDELWEYDPRAAQFLHDLFGDVDVPSSCHYKY